MEHTERTDDAATLETERSEPFGEDRWCACEWCMANDVVLTGLGDGHWD